MTITSQQVDAWDAAVDAAYEAGRQEGMKQEREACAKVVEDQDTYGDVVGGWFELLAEKIRARGNT